MFWNRIHFPHTLKWRIALSCALLFLLSFLIVFFVVLFHVASSVRFAADLRLNAVYHEIAYEFLTGNKPPPDVSAVRKWENIPAQLRAAVGKTMPDFQPLLAFRGTDDKSKFILIGRKGEDLFRGDAEIDGEEAFVDWTRIPHEDKTELVAQKIRSGAYGDAGKTDRILLLDSKGNEIARTQFPSEELPILRDALLAADEEDMMFHGAMVRGHRHRIRLACRRLCNGDLLAIGADMHNEDDVLERVAIAFLCTGSVVLLLSGIVGWLFTKKTFDGLERVGRTARKIASGDYSLRVAHENSGQEIETLVSDFNFMVDSAESLMNELRTVSDDIAHDLRTPLTRMIACAEAAFSGEQTISSYRNALADNAEECCSMLALINAMLEISRTESGAASLKREEFDAAALVARSVDIFRMPAERKGVALSARLPIGKTAFRGDPAKLQTLVGNLIDNALKFTPEGGSVSVELRADANALTLVVADTGEGIAEADRERVFQRFYRADSSRNKPGNGLGLAMVQAIAHAHDGRVELESAAGKGSRFTVVLPRSAQHERT